jgi:hypothetical protein
VTSPPPTTPNLPNLGFNRGPQPSSFNFAAVSSPLATSPPVMAMQDNEAAPAPKIKLSLNKLKKPVDGG